MTNSSKNLEISHKNNRYESRFELGLIEKSIEILASNLNGENIIEFGCGLGATTQFLSQNVERVTSVEYSPYFIEITKPKCLDNVSFIESKWGEFKSNDEFSDIILFRALDCVDDVDEILNIVKSISNENTVTHIVITNTNSFHRILGDKLEKDKINTLTDRAKEVGRLQSLNYDVMLKFIEIHKFEMLDFKGIGFKMFPNDVMDAFSENRIKAFLDMGDVAKKHAVELYFKVKCK